MTEYDLLVLNGLVVTDSETGEFDIAVKDGKIAKVVPRGSLAGEKSKKTIDAQGGMVMVREPWPLRDWLSFVRGPPC
jgi:dihydropyrimidinase